MAKARSPAIGLFFGGYVEFVCGSLLTRGVSFKPGLRALQSIQRYWQYQRPIAWHILFWPNPSLNSHSL